MPEESFLTLQMHELLSYLAQQGVATFLVVAQQGVFGQSAPVDVSYISDTVLLLRNFEAAGRLRKAMSVVKKRSGRHDNTIRELILASTGMAVGPTLEELHGVLTGTPTSVGNGNAARTR